MDPQVCGNCFNKKPVNLTTNRLVTESCGHVKCMDCLLNEKSGCKACLREKSQLEYEDGCEEDSLLSQCSVSITTEETDLVLNEKAEACDKASTEIKKKKPETSHINIEEVDGNVKYYFCTVCKKKFHARSQVAYHAYCNGQRKPYQCPECNKSFATHSHFKYHMRVHRNERTYACEVCGESFFQMSKLQRHKLKHTKEKKFACPQCNAAFNNLSSLRKHALTHTEERPYECATCARAFRDSSNYKKHVAKHAGFVGSRSRSLERRAFQCPRCPLAFRSKKDMRRHGAVHSDSKPFRCKVCDRRFRRKDNLERHIRNTHPNYDTSSVIEFDERALTEQLSTTTDSPIVKTNKEEAYEKNRLEILNPLPPLSPEVIKRHMRPPEKNVIEEMDKNLLLSHKAVLEANNARESVIFGPINRKEVITQKQDESQEHEYVHKIKKLNCWGNPKEVSLPPVDHNKIIELNEKTCANNLDLGQPTKNLDVYQKILYRNASDKIIENGRDNTSPEMHWKRKMTFNIN